MTETPKLTYLRHPKGNGKLFGEAEACDRSFIDRDSEISDDASIWRSRIIASKIVDSTVSGSVIDSSHIAYSNVHGSRIESSMIDAEFIGENTQITGSVILGKSRVANGAACRNVKFRDLTVTGNAVLEDWGQDADQILDGHHGYITRGVWRRPPRIFVISPTITVTEGVQGYAFMHCRERMLDFWLKIGHRYGAACNWTPNQVLAVRKVMHLLLKTPLPL